MFSKNINLNFFLHFIFLGLLCFYTSNLSAQINCNDYSNILFELIKDKDYSKIDDYIQPIEQQLRIVHWENTAENIALIDAMNKAIEDTIIASIYKIHQEFKSNGISLKKAKFSRCELDRDKGELFIYFNCNKKEYWIKAFTDFIYLEDRFKSQFDTTMTMTEEFNQRIHRTEPKPLEPILLSTKKLEILKTCYSENDINQYGKLEDLLTILETTLESGIIEIVSMCNTDKCRGKLVIFHLNPKDETCKIILE